MMHTPRLQAHIRAVGYGKKTVLRDVELTLDAGELLAVIGKNGCGKSTLLAALCGLLPFEGEACVDGVSLSTLTPRERAQRVAMMIQQPRLPHVTVDELLRFGRSPYHGLSTHPNDTDRAAIEEAVRSASLESLRASYLDRLSGGEARRAYFGLLLAQTTPLLLLDEATAFADTAWECRMLGELKRQCRERGRSVVLVTHSLEQAVTYADRLVVLDGGTVRYFGTPQALTQDEELQRIFSVRALRATDGEGRAQWFFSPRED
ncbi:MAG: ABC transporter ATP-binding protein [Clostridia bacterium]|nr:ABC transporter ATP-binding protein [Clostridia bacterium]